MSSGSEGMMTLSSGRSAFTALRELARPQPAPAERCDLCGAGLAPEHEHLVVPAERRLLCCCRACGMLFQGRPDGRYRLAPRRVQRLTDFRMTDAQWEDLRIPIDLAFFFFNSAAGRVVAVYPSPAGATESLLTLDAWRDLESDNPVLPELEPDVEALLVYRIAQERDYFRVSIDECYKLVGIVRTHWRGLSGGTEVWREMGRFFAGLKERADA